MLCGVGHRSKTDGQKYKGRADWNFWNRKWSVTPTLNELRAYLRGEIVSLVTQVTRELLIHFYRELNGNCSQKKSQDWQKVDPGWKTDFEGGAGWHWSKRATSLPSPPPPHPPQKTLPTRDIIVIRTKPKQREREGQFLYMLVRRNNSSFISRPRKRCL